MMRFSALTLLFLVNAALALVHGTDSSAVISVSFYQKARSGGFVKTIPRGYQAACGIGGRVDPNFVATYENARAAGFTNIDTYWSPCTGAGNSCKPYSTQISELGATFVSNHMMIGTIWIYLEVDPACHNWNYGTSGNLAQARGIISAARASGFNFGIYSSPGEWGTIFGSRGVVLDNSLPLWFATYDNVQTLTLTHPFGGWTTAVGKQYTDQSASSQSNLDVFEY